MALIRNQTLYFKIELKNERKGTFRLKRIQTKDVFEMLRIRKREFFILNGSLNQIL